MASDAIERRFLNLPVPSLIASLILHLLIPVSFFTFKVLDHFGIHLFPDRKIIKDAYQSFIQVDVVALPDVAANEKVPFDASLPIVEKPETAPEEEKKTEVKDDVMQTHDDQEAKAKAEKEKQEMALKKEKEKAEKKRHEEQEKALKKLQADAKREQALKALQAKNGQKGRGKLKGNILSQGTATSGAIGNAKDRYTAILTEAIKQHFNIYLWQQKKNLIAEVEFELFPTGRIRRKKVVKNSIDPTYDSAILKAIDDAQPLPLPDDPSLIGEDFHITFKP